MKSSFNLRSILGQVSMIHAATIYAICMALEFGVGEYRSYVLPPILVVLLHIICLGISCSSFAVGGSSWMVLHHVVSCLFN